MNALSLQNYYRMFMPWQTLCRLLLLPADYRTSAGFAIRSLRFREFAMSYPDRRRPQSTDLIMQRYQTFYSRDEEQVAGAASRLATHMVRNCPLRIDIGAEWNAEPEMRALQLQLEPFKRELVFDIDATDYTERECPCSTAGSTQRLCQHCWQFIAAAVTTLDFLLRARFGYQDLLWVFSGGRGVHCWVLDASVLLLDKADRTLIVEFFAQQANCRKTPQRLDAPYLAQLYTDILQPRFERMLDSGLIDLGKEANRQIIAECMNNTGAATLLNQVLLPQRLVQSGQHVWERCKKTLATETLLRIAFTFAFPRLDAGVSTNPAHLIRAPLSVHQGTGNICVVLEPGRVDEFRLEAVPNIRTGVGLDGLPAHCALFERGSLPRRSYAHWLVCRLCASEQPAQALVASLLERRMLFYEDVQAWTEHMSAQHSAVLPDAPEDSTLGSVFALHALDLQHWTENSQLKEDLYRQVEAYFSVAT